MTESQSAKQHLVILQHGLHGFPLLLRTFSGVLESANTEDRIICHLAQSNSFLATHDGIDKCGDRLADEVMKTAKQHNLPPGTRISFVGHSLGGLIARYAIGKLHEQGYLDYFEPWSFVTFASPHAGATVFRSSWFRPLVNIYCGFIIGRTGKQLAFADTDSGEEPLLLQMTKGPFIEGLRRFQHRVVYSNISNDIQVPFETAALLKSNPYAKMKTLTYHSQFPHLVQPDPDSIEEQTDHRSTDVTDPHLSYSHMIVERLQQLRWVRHAVHFAVPFGHDLIIGKFSFLPGIDVIMHCATMYFKAKSGGN